MSDVFISHEKKDAEFALAVAAGLKAQGYSTWCYEEDSIAGVSYLVQINQEIAKAHAIVLVISPHSLGSNQVTNEVVQAHERDKKIIPLLHGITHAEFQERQPEWRAALGAAASIRVPPNGAAAVVPKIVEGLRALGVEPGGPPSPGAPRPGPTTTPSASKQRARVRRAWLKRAAVAVPALLAVVVAVLSYRLWLPSAPPKDEGPLVVGVMEIHARGRVPEWMRDFTRDGLNTVLSKVNGLRVYSKQKIDFTREQRKLKEIEAAEQLQIGKMISGTIASADSHVMLEVQVVDIKSGMLEDSEHVEGQEEELVELQNRLVIALVRKLNVALSEDELQELVKDRTNDTLKSYKRFTETLDAFTGTFDEPSEPKAPHEKGAWQMPWPATANAGESAGEPEAVRALLEQYRAALEAKDLDRLAAVHVAMSDAQRQALAHYFQGVADLTVKFTDVDVQVEGEKALATFTRNDYFKDAETGRETHLEVRLSSEMAKQKEGWRIRGLKKPS